MKVTLESRPIYVRTPEHIQAHLMICFMALTIMRVMQHKIKAVLPPQEEECCWMYGLPGKRFAKALADWQVDKLPGDYYRMLDVASEDLKVILKALGMTIPVKLFSRGNLWTLKASAKIF